MSTKLQKNISLGHKFLSITVVEGGLIAAQGVLNNTTKGNSSNINFYAFSFPLAETL